MYNRTVSQGERRKKQMMDVVALGECLIDFTPDGVNGLGAPLYA